MGDWDALSRGVYFGADAVKSGINAKNASEERLFWHLQGKEREKQRNMNDIGRMMLMEKLADKRQHKNLLQGDILNQRGDYRDILTNDIDLPNDVRAELEGAFQSTYNPNYDPRELPPELYRNLLVTRAETKRTAGKNQQTYDDTQEAYQSEVDDAISAVTNDPDQFTNNSAKLTRLRSISDNVRTQGNITEDDRKFIAGLYDEAGGYIRKQDASKGGKTGPIVKYHGGEIPLDVAKILLSYHDKSMDDLRYLQDYEDPDRVPKMRYHDTEARLLLQGIEEGSMKYPDIQSTVTDPGTVSQPPPEPEQPSPEDQKRYNALSSTDKQLVDTWLQAGRSLADIWEAYDLIKANTYGGID
jgi:hypothetical protein